MMQPGIGRDGHAVGSCLVIHDYHLDVICGCLKAVSPMGASGLGPDMLRRDCASYTGDSPPARFLSDSIIISTSDLVRRIDREGFCLSGVMLWVLPVTVLTNGRAEKVHPAIEIGRASCRERVCQYV